MRQNTQIIATIGPASIDLIKEMYSAGLSGVRINSSHGDFDQHKKIIANARQVSKEIFVIYDIKGPKIRIGDLREPLLLKAGMKLRLISADPGASQVKEEIPVTYPDFHKYVKATHRLLLDDGLIALHVDTVNDKVLSCTVIYGDILRSRKGINHPDTIIDFPFTVEEDIPLIEFAKQQGVDYIADSFERSKADVEELRSRVLGTNIKIISKIENPEGVKAFDEIVEVTDSIMIARGDLGVELDPWEIPELQKEFIEHCNAVSKSVIVATQMLESMIEDPRPSRADVSDIANAIYDGADVVMLSGETSTGKYPVESVKMMSKIIKKTISTERYKKLNKKNNFLKALEL